ncbi:MAG TPA: SprT family zinc-dependent metalloprotease [Candidatus Saccharimonadales bacterium]|nr:SprT family zinc-dependent metalloprotease [Candidatus Saccharimonadales bacterium]
MAYKQFVLDEHLSVTIYKRRASRNLRLTVGANGEVRVSIPVWTSYRAGVEFARSRRDWIARQGRRETPLSDGQAIGKAHRLRLVADASARRIATRLRQNEVLVSFPADLSPADPTVQTAARKAGVRALRQEAEALLPRRLEQLAEQHGFRYRSVKIKQLKGRWGSCDNNADIVLNLFLMQLPWECIDYVLLHELTHTQVMRHGPDFWRAMEAVLPDVKQLRKLIRQQQPVLQSAPTVA